MATVGCWGSGRGRLAPYKGAPFTSISLPNMSLHPFATTLSRERNNPLTYFGVLLFLRVVLFCKTGILLGRSLGSTEECLSSSAQVGRLSDNMSLP